MQCGSDGLYLSGVNPEDPQLPTSRDDGQTPERLLMDRFRERASRPEQEMPRRTVQHVVALLLALGLVGTILFGFDAFLTAMQKYMETPIGEPAPAPATQAAPPAANEPIEAYVVEE